MALTISTMEDSILNTIKHMLGLDESYDAFDVDIITMINSVMLNLCQLGIGPTTGFVLTDDSQTWSELIGTDKNLLAVQTYVYLKTRLLFDPPSSSFVADSMTKQIAELEWRLNVQNEMNHTTTSAEGV